LDIDQTGPIEVSGQWAKITGTTDPQATLEVDLETRAEPEVDPKQVILPSMSKFHTPDILHVP